jgi:hypothetical protein
MNRLPKATEQINTNIEKITKLKKAEDLEKQNQVLAKNNENEKKALKLKKEQKEINDDEILLLETEVEKEITVLNGISNVVSVSFDSNEEMEANKYVRLTGQMEKIQTNIDNITGNVLSIYYLFWFKIATTTLVIFLFIRAAGEDDTLIKSFLYLNIFESLFEQDYAFYIDLLIQDILIVTAIAFSIAIVARDYDSFFSLKIRSRIIIAFLISVIGLFVSSSLYNY